MPKDAKRQNTIAPEETSIFCEQVGLILSSGMPLHDGIEALSESYASTKDSEYFKALSKHVTESGSLADALEAAQMFPEYMIQMTRIGETTGKLESVMNGLSEYYLRESKVRRAVINAVTYPLVLMVMMACVIGVLIGNVMPIFEQALGSMGMNAGDTANALMRFGMNLGKGVLGIVGLLMVLILVVWLLLKTKLRGKIIEIASRMFPPVSRLFKRMSAARFASVMSMMMASGFPMDDSLKMLPSVLSDEDTRAKVDVMAKKMEEGTSFPDALNQSRIFDELHSRMISMGFLAGQSDVVMHKVATIYDEEVDEGIARLISIIEPSLVALLSVVIGAILLSVMMPMANIISSIV